MPELPEVETIARQLGPLLSGRRISSVELLDPLLGRLPTSRLVGRRVAAVFRSGKEIVLELEDPGRGIRPVTRLAVHLRMTGRLSWCPHGDPALSASEHLRACIGLDGGVLLFRDQRRFGTLRLLEGEISPRGADPTSSEFTAEVLRTLLARSQQEIKVWLLRQDRVEGLGNIYASEVLFQARIHPRRQAGLLRRHEVARLHRAIQEVLARAIAHAGTTFSDYRDARGGAGAFQEFLCVFRREGQGCRRCGTSIQRMVQMQRSTYFCERCQPAGPGASGESRRRR